MQATLLNSFRYYQQEADNALYQELVDNSQSKALIKMFCGTGKSLLMAKNKIHQTSKLSLFVFPSLALITQFRNDYLNKITKNVLSVSSEDESTTDTNTICRWLELSVETTKYVCVTYQSYDVLVDCLQATEIIADVAMYDEAHRAVGKSYQEHIFHFGEDRHVHKQIFFTATPKKDNGIVMYDRENPESGMCGRLVFDYSYFRGMIEGYLNTFEIRLNFSTKNDKNDMYETIARAILETGNTRVLTFHSDVETDRDYSVSNFTNEAEFKHAFEHICQAEFPDQVGRYQSQNIHMVALSASTNDKERKQIIGNLDASRDDSIYIICSCKTIGEGIDTKRANMCVFVDPKSSLVDITQNIGRIVRHQPRPSTVLIPCWVDREKYESVQDDPEARDEVIRQDVQETGGNFNGILNVLSAIKQEDEDLYDACLHYPSRFSPKEIKHNLERQGYKIVDPVDEDGDLLQNLGYVVDEELDGEEYEDCDGDDAIIQRVAEDKNVCIEIHTDSLEQSVTKYNEDCESGEVVRLFRTTTTEEEMEEDEEEGSRYQPIVEKEGRKRNRDRNVEGPDRKKRLYVNVHNNDDVKVLWKVSGDGMLDGICNAIEPEVTRIDPMEIARGIVERAKERESRGGRLLPRQTENDKLEKKDHRKIKYWKKALEGNSRGKCSQELCDYLNNNLPGWRKELNEKAMEDAIGIVERAKERQSKCKIMLPKDSKLVDKQEQKDARKLMNWKQSLNGNGRSICPTKVMSYLDEHLLDWRKTVDFDEKAMEDAIEIVGRAKERESNDGRLFPSHTSEDIQERRDARRMRGWRCALKGNKNLRCSQEVSTYLDNNLPGWKTELNEKAMEQAIEIVERANQRVSKGGLLLPTQSKHSDKQERDDTLKLVNWKQSLDGNGKSICPPEVVSYLDKNLLNWRKGLNEKAMEFAKGIVERSKERLKKKGRFIPSNSKNSDSQEQKDAQKIQDWKKALAGKKGTKCPQEIRDYLDQNLPGWRGSHEEEQDDTSSVSSTSTTSSTPNSKPKKKSTPKKSMELAPPPPPPRQKTPEEIAQEREHTRRINKSALSEYHKLFKTMRSDNLHQRFKDNHAEFIAYHQCALNNELSYEDPTEIPLNKIISKLEENKHKKTKTLLDLGCGLEPKIRDHFAEDTRYEVRSFDHVSMMPGVEECDISNLPVEEDSVDYVVLSLAMWGSNCREYLREAHRVLDSNGRLYIGEPTKRWTPEETESRPAQRLIELLEESGFKIVDSDIKKFSLFTCVKI